VVQKSEKDGDGEEANIQSEVERFKNYAKSLPSQKSHIQTYLSQLKQRKEKIAALGAGHLMCSFINLLEVNTLIDVVVDDNPHKQGLYMPGSKIPIVSSRVLESEGIKICLMGVNPENEAKVFEKNRWRFRFCYWIALYKRGVDSQGLGHQPQILLRRWKSHHQIWVFQTLHLRLDFRVSGNQISGYSR
jgi:hypothetical protein